MLSAPKILHIKTKTDELGRKARINFSESVNMIGLHYKLKSAMLYSGTGNQGHWRSLIKETVGFGLYSDAHQPEHITSETALKLALRMSTDVIYIAEDIGDIVSETSETANMDDQQTPPHGTDNLPKPLPSSSKSTEVHLRQAYQ